MRQLPHFELGNWPHTVPVQDNSSNPRISLRMSVARDAYSATRPQVTPDFRGLGSPGFGPKYNFARIIRKQEWMLRVAFSNTSFKGRPYGPAQKPLSIATCLLDIKISTYIPIPTTRRQPVIPTKRRQPVIYKCETLLECGSTFRKSAHLFSFRATDPPTLS